MRLAAWLVLAALLAATIAGAVTFDRRSWPGLVGDEATYLMAAGSLAWEQDLRYERSDYDRFFARWGVQPEGLILQSTDGGKTLVYGKPAAYPLFLAPFVQISPTHGPWLANALLLALAAVVTALALERRLGPAASLWVAEFVFASVTFAYVFWAHADLFLGCLAAIALALVYGGTWSPTWSPAWSPAWPPAPMRRAAPIATWRLLAAGVLLGVVVLSRPLYAPLLLPALLAAPRGTRRRAFLVLAAGVLGIVALSTAGNLLARGSWTGYGGERRSFYSYTGFPQVGDGAGDWSQQIGERGDANWIKRETFQMGFDGRQTAWNVVYYVAGRHVGVLPYFLPVLLGIWAFRRGEGRWALPLAALLAAALLFWVRPFNFYGGGGAIANRYFLPAYPALWFLAARPVRGVRALLPPVLAAALAAPFLWPLWSDPRSFPIGEDGGYRWTSGTAREWLPYETTLSHLKPAGEEDLHLGGLWVKLLTPGLHAVEDGTALGAPAGGPAELLVGSPQPLAGVLVEPLRGKLSIEGELLPRPADGSHLLPFRRPRAVHRMWWSDDSFYLYAVRVRPAAGGPEAVFRLRAHVGAQPPSTHG